MTGIPLCWSCVGTYFTMRFARIPAFLEKEEVVVRYVFRLIMGDNFTIRVDGFVIKQNFVGSVSVSGSVVTENPVVRNAGSGGGNFRFLLLLRRISLI